MVIRDGNCREKAIWGGGGMGLSAYFGVATTLFKKKIISCSIIIRLDSVKHESCKAYKRGNTSLT